SSSRRRRSSSSGVDNERLLQAWLDPGDRAALGLVDGVDFNAKTLSYHVHWELLVVEELQQNPVTPLDRLHAAPNRFYNPLVWPRRVRRSKNCGFVIPLVD